MGLREGNPEFERFNVHAGTDRKARQKVACVGGHIGSGLVVITYADMEFFRWNEIGCEDEVAEEVGTERFFQFKAILRCSVARIIIWKFPFGEVPCCYRETDRQ